ncbi:hypothetical protein Cri9333_2164 [Crinalium epipsammum PCC 9333]|uniref:Uncharacterized protein n=1 Tax=Crinalium epipsammum PCC 9333 TaxID=1173022 RepID=K9VZU6_9CYAN|nr:hypothetical protein Cri9333_2164 [Crinalium epipsammum PCC 9333]
MAVLRAANWKEPVSITDIFPTAKPLAELQCWAEIASSKLAIAPLKLFDLQL